MCSLTFTHRKLCYVMLRELRDDALRNPFRASGSYWPKSQSGSGTQKLLRFETVGHNILSSPPVFFGTTRAEARGTMTIAEGHCYRRGCPRRGGPQGGPGGGPRGVRFGVRDPFSGGQAISRKIGILCTRRGGVPPPGGGVPTGFRSIFGVLVTPLYILVLQSDIPRTNWGEKNSS
jgi:hypothetical protein